MDKKYNASLVKCDCCGHQWVAVKLGNLIKLECPNCDTLRSFEEIKIE